MNIHSFHKTVYNLREYNNSMDYNRDKDYTESQKNVGLIQASPCCKEEEKHT
jgi:hypothetical protein